MTLPRNNNCRVVSRGELCHNINYNKFSTSGLLTLKLLYNQSYIIIPDTEFEAIVERLGRNNQRILELYSFYNLMKRRLRNILDYQEKILVAKHSNIPQEYRDLMLKQHEWFYNSLKQSLLKRVNILLKKEKMM